MTGGVSESNARSKCGQLMPIVVRDRPWYESWRTMIGPAGLLFFSASFTADSTARLPCRQKLTLFRLPGAIFASRLARRSSGIES